jgi:hypothetical protein
VPLFYLATCSTLIRRTSTFVYERWFRRCHDSCPTVAAHGVRSPRNLGANGAPHWSSTLVTVSVDRSTQPFVFVWFPGGRHSGFERGFVCRTTGTLNHCLDLVGSTVLGTKTEHKYLPPRVLEKCFASLRVCSTLAASRRKHVLLGASHQSELSAQVVEVAIEHLRPDAVVVELCQSRPALLNSDEADGDGIHAQNTFSLSGEGGLLQTVHRGASPSSAAGHTLLLRVFLARATAMAPAGA